MHLLFVWMMWTSPVLVGCGEPAPQVAVRSETIEVGCGTCMFKQVGGRGCYWAAKVEGETYPMQGEVLPSEKELPSHGAEGMCTMSRRAVVDGSVLGGMFTVTKFELLPADVDAPRADPHDHEH